MHAFRSRPSFLSGPRLDAELVDLDMPGFRPHLRRGQPVEQALAGRQDRPHRRMRPDRLGDRLEPALDAAMQRVVIAALVMRLVRLARNALRARAKRGEAAAAIAPAIGHVGVEAEIVPTARETVPIAQPRLSQHAAHFRRVHIGKACAGNGLCDVGEPIGHRLMWSLSSRAPDRPCAVRSRRSGRRAGGPSRSPGSRRAAH